MTHDEFFDEKSIEISEIYLDYANKIYARYSRVFADTLKIEDTTLQKAQQAKDIQELEDYLFKSTRTLDVDTRKVIHKIVNDTVEFAHSADKQLYEQLKIEFVPANEHKLLQKLADNTEKQIIDTVNNEIKFPPDIENPSRKQIAEWTKSTAIKAIDSKGNRRSIPKMYQDELDTAIRRMQSGGYSYDKAIREAIKTLVDGGIVRVGYEGEGKRPVNRSIESVVRMAVLTASTELAGKATISNIIELGAKHCSVSKHNGARTGKGFGDIADHSAFQGRCYSLDKTFFDRYGNQADLLGIQIKI